MNRLSIVSSTNPRTLTCFPRSSQRRIKHFIKGTSAAFYVGIAAFMLLSPVVGFAQGEREREPIEMGVMAVNPSEVKTQTVEIKTYLPAEITPADVLDSAGLNIEFDSQQSLYYVYQEELPLAPGETRTFNVELRDVWFIPQGRLDSLRAQTESVISRLEGSQFYDSAVLLGETIYKSLDTVALTQDDEAVSRRSHIGIYRKNLGIVEQIKDDVDRLEKQLVVASSLPKPEVLEEAKLKTESPTDSTSWMIIFIIMLFIGMLAGVFFFTWHTQAHSTHDLITEARERSFPEGGGSDEEKE